jgi:maleylacetate reductase
MGTSESGLAKAIWELGAAVGTPEGLRAIGIGEDDLGRLVEAAVAKRLTSPRPIDSNSLYSAVHAAWAGQPPQDAPEDV